MTGLSTDSAFAFWGRYDPDVVIPRFRVRACNHGVAEGLLTPDEMEAFVD